MLLTMIALWFGVSIVITWLTGFNIITVGIWLYNGVMIFGLLFFLMMQALFPPLITDAPDWMCELDDSSR